MIEQLFGSKTRVKLLQLFYSNPNRSFYVREITRKIDEQINSVRRELSNLLNIGIISSENTNNRLYYEVNKSYQFHEPLSQIFGSAAGVSGDEEGGEAAAQLKGLGNIELVLYTGKFTRDNKSGIDFLIVGDINQTQLAKYISELEKKEGKEVRYAVMDRDEFNYRKEVNDRFLTTVLESKKQIVINKGILLENNGSAVEANTDDASTAQAVEEPAANKKKAAK